MTKSMLFDGKANISLDQYPNEAWQNLSPNRTMVNDSRADVLPTQGYYEMVAWLYRCVELRANGISRIPWAIMQGGNEIWHSRDPKVPPKLNFLSGLKKLLWLTEACLCLAPEAYWFRERNRVKTTGIKWIAPLSAAPVWDETEGITGFNRTLNGIARTFPVEDFVYIPRPNPLHETVAGRPPAQAAMSAAGVVYSVDAFAAGFFERGAIKSTLLTVDGDPVPEELDKLKLWWKRFFTGAKNAWSTATVRANVKPVIVGEGVQELGNNELTKEKKEDIATGMGVPHSLVFSSAANFATAEQDTLNFYDLTLVPESTMILDALNAQVFEPMGLSIQSRAEELSVFQADENERGTSLKNYVDAGMPLHIAAEVLGINLPAGTEYTDLIPEQTQTFRVIEPEPPAQIVDTQAVEQEKSQFRRWASRRKSPKPSDFKSNFMTESDKYAILDDLVKGGKQSAHHANSFRLGWEEYP